MNKFDEKTEKSFGEIFSADSIEFKNVPAQEPCGFGIIQRSLQEAIKTGSSFAKIESGAIVNVDKSKIFNGE